ncbi:MAG TPA: histidinol-phosphate transaminase [Polyangiaceae bacterium]|nr:histidinol-phosphate transaminase [Polyangiaceae bacterium]
MSGLVTPSIESLVAYEGGKPIEEVAREFGVASPIKLASNENPLGPSPKALRAAFEALNSVNRYPDGVAFRLRHALAEAHQVGFDEVLHGSGSNELIELVVRTFCTPSDHIIFGEPGFAMYRVIAMAHGVEHTAVPTIDFKHDLSGFLQAIRPNTKVMLIDNPNNPTGTYQDVERVIALLREVPAQVIVVMDEAYFEYVTANDYPNSLQLRHLRERLIVTRTFSKIYGLAGMRVGFGIGPAPLMNYMNRLRPPFNVSLMSQEAAVAALGDHEHVDRSRQHNHAERARLSRELAALGLEVTPSQANFVLVHFDRPTRPLNQALLERGVIVRPIPALPRALRISVGTSAENDRLLAALAEVGS